MNFYLLSIALFSGFILPIQGAINSRLGTLMPHPMQSTLVSYIGGIIACMAVLLFVQPNAPDTKKLFEIEWYLYCGGFLGTIFVSSMLYLIPKIGVTNMLATAIVGQLIMSILLDHFGGFGNPVIQINYSRIFGVLLLLLGLHFIQR